MHLDADATDLGIQQLMCVGDVSFGVTCVLNCSDVIFVALAEHVAAPKPTQLHQLPRQEAS